MQKIFFDKISKKIIVDISGEKELKQIKKEFGNGNYQELVIDESIEGYTIDTNGNLLKTNLSMENEKSNLLYQKEKQKKEASLNQRQTAIQTKLGLTKSEFENLKK